MRESMKSADAIDIIELSLQRPGMGKSFDARFSFSCRKTPLLSIDSGPARRTLPRGAGPLLNGLDENWLG